jgi:hypothetical protein
LNKVRARYPLEDHYQRIAFASLPSRQIGLVVIAFVLYEWAGAHDVPFFCVGVSVGRAEHLLAGPFQTNAAACAWIEMLLSFPPHGRRTAYSNKRLPACS